MIKKMMILLIMFIFSIVMVNQGVFASSVFIPEPAANTGGLWHVEDGNRAYVYMRYVDGDTVIETGNFPAGVHDYLFDFDEYASNPDGNDYSQFTYWPDYRENDLSFANSSDEKTAIINNPDPSQYNTFKIEIIANMTSEWRSSRGEPQLIEIASYSDTIDEIKVDLFDKSDLSCVHDYSFIRLSVDNEKVLTTRQLTEASADICLSELMGPFPEDYDLPEANPNYEYLSFGVRMYWEKATTEEEIDPGASDDPWSLLPDTSGNPVNPIGDWGTVSNFNVAGQQVSFDIDYNGATYPVSQFTVEGNLDFTSKVNDILFYTDPSNGDRILYFNFGETLNSAMLTAESFDNVNEWKGEALWNLSQNEIKVTDVLKVYNYIPEVDSDGNVYSYFYMPDVPIDSLISVSSVLAYRYWDDGFLWVEPSPGETQYKVVSAVRDESTSVNPTWVESTYKTSYIASGFSAGLLGGALIGGTAVPVVGWAVPAALFLVGATFQIADANEFFAYDVEQIQNVIPEMTLINEINSYIAEEGGLDTFSPDTDKLYKLHLATLQDGDEVEIMDQLSNVTQVVWESDGEIYVINDPYIEDTWFGPGTEIPLFDNRFDIPSELVWAGIGIIGVYTFFKLKLDKKPGLLILLLGVAFYILYNMGLI